MAKRFGGCTTCLREWEKDVTLHSLRAYRDDLKKEPKRFFPRIEKVSELEIANVISLIRIIEKTPLCKE